MNSTNLINLSTLIHRSSGYLTSRDDVCFAYLFGSFAKDRANHLSDIDIAVYLFKDSHTVDTKIDMLTGLGCALKTDGIDLVILNTAPESLLMRILHTKIILVDKEPFQRHRFESLMMRKCLDFSFLENKILERRFLHG